MHYACSAYGSSLHLVYSIMHRSSHSGFFSSTCVLCPVNCILISCNFAVLHVHHDSLRQHASSTLDDVYIFAHNLHAKFIC